MENLLCTAIACFEQCSNVDDYSACQNHSNIVGLLSADISSCFLLFSVYCIFGIYLMEYIYLLLVVICMTFCTVGDVLTEHGHYWVGMDISSSMLDVALDRDCEGDVMLGDMGQGMPFRAGAFDGCIR